MIPWYKPTLTGKEIEYLKKVIDSNFLNDGEWTTEFEKRFADFHKVKYAVGVTSGTMALFLALRALRVGYGDKVIVPDLTFIATANAVTWTGAKPILMDIRLSDLNLNPNKITKAKAIILVHINGRIASHDYSIPVIQDCCQALGTAFNGLIGCYSFAPSKIITTGQGGMVVTNNRKLYYRLRELKDQGRRNRGTGGDDTHPVLGFNAKLTNLQSAVGLAQLETLKERMVRMKLLHANYRYFLKQVIPHDGCPQWIDMICGNERDKLCAFLLKNGIETRKFWYPLHIQKPYQCKGDFKVSTIISKHCLWLPSSPYLTSQEMGYVCEKVRRFYGS
jgi:perosamine synthetase